MLPTMLKCALRCGAFEKNISLESFTERVTAQHMIVESSVVKSDAGIYMIRNTGKASTLIIITQYERILDSFNGASATDNEAGVNYYGLECALSHENALSLRNVLRWTAPRALDTGCSFGCGDRIGDISPATPWHIEACRRYDMTPVLAQQSVRENTKTGRTFESVLDDATWSVFSAGYRKPWGADADHLKTLDEIEAAAGAGYTMFTLDPSDMIDYQADTDSDEILRGKLGMLFSTQSEIDTFLSRYEGISDAGEGAVVRSAVKYLAAVRHATEAYRRIAGIKGGDTFDFEMSIDETITPTSPLDHRIIASELALESVKLFSLAPRFEGRFEKGIDYIGTVDGFRRSLEEHAAIAGELGGYRLSLHSGSDKFSIYPVFGEVTDGYYHVKTAGTSFLEAVKVAAQTDIKLFRSILSLALDTFEENARSYDISADAGLVPAPSELSTKDAVEEITGNPHMRQVLHIAFGKILTTMGGGLRSLLRDRSEYYRENIVGHIGKHLSLLTGQSAS